MPRLASLTLQILTGVGRNRRPLPSMYTLDNPNPFSDTAADFYGLFVAIDSDLAIVSSSSEDDEGTGTFATYDGVSGQTGGDGRRSGKAYAYNAIYGQLVHTFDNPNIRGKTSGDNFGSVIFLTPDYIIISAINESFTHPGALTANGNGTVYIFDRATFSLLRTLVNPNVYGPNTGYQDYFGRSIAVTQNFLFIGSLEDAASAVPRQINSGVVYLYDITDGIGITAPDAVIDNPDPGGGTGAGDDFGRVMAADGNLLVVSAPGDDDADPAGPFVLSRGRGKVYVFNATTRQLLLTLDNPNTTNPDFDFFGWSVDIVGNNIAVGAFQNDEENQGVRTGKVYIFDATTGALLRTLNNPNENILYFGVSVALGGNRVLVGAGDSATTVGAVYVFDLTTGELLTRLSSNIVGDRFGSSIDVSGSNVIIGAARDNANLGKAYIYNLSQVGQQASVEFTILDEDWDTFAAVVEGPEMLFYSVEPTLNTLSILEDIEAFLLTPVATMEVYVNGNLVGSVTIDGFDSEFYEQGFIAIGSADGWPAPFSGSPQPAGTVIRFVRIG
jgi:hypothetical protein